MEDLFREILAPSPVSAPAALPSDPNLYSASSSAPDQTQTHVPSSTTVALPIDDAPTSGARATSINTTTVTGGNEGATVETIDWEAESEMQRLLDLLPLVQPQPQSHANVNINTNAPAQSSAGANADTLEIVDFPSVLDVELCGWDLESIVAAPSLVQNPQVGVF